MKSTSMYRTVIIIGIISVIQSISAADETDISRLRSDLLRNYDRNSRPVQSHHNSTDVDIYIYNHGFEFDEYSGLMTLHCMPVVSWKDEHMKWNPLNYGNLTEIQFHADEIWRPDLMAYNNVDKSEIDHFGNTLLVAYNSSWIFWVPPAKFQVRCATEFLRWPYDQQTCIIYLGSWAHDGLDINLTLRENHTKMDSDDLWNPPLSNREWKLEWDKIERSVSYYTFSSVPYIDITLSMLIQRRSSSHTAAITVVAIGITVSILISFWLDPFANERVPVILVAIFLNALYLYHVYRIIPYNGPTVPYAVCFFRDSLLMVTIALLWTILIRHIAKSKRNSPVPLPGFVQTLLDSVFASILCLNPRPTVISGGRSATLTPSNGDANEDNDELVKQENQYQEDWAWLAHLLDRIAFLFYLIVYTTFLILFS